MGEPAVAHAQVLRRRPITEGCRVRHMIGAEGLPQRVEGNQVFVLWDAGGEELLLAGFLEAIPEGLSA
jgi:hypothetical protein